MQKLGENKIGDKGAIELSKALKYNTIIQELSLSKSVTKLI